MIVPEEPAKQQTGQKRRQGHGITLRLHRTVESKINGPAHALRSATRNPVQIVVATAADVPVVFAMIQEKAVIPFPISHSIV